jgi:hypothetical protein
MHLLNNKQCDGCHAKAIQLYLVTGSTVFRYKTRVIEDFSSNFREGPKTIKILQIGTLILYLQPVFTDNGEM